MIKYSEMENHAAFGCCKKCGARVECIDSRGYEIYRRRRYRCPDCEEVFTTREIYVEEWEEILGMRKTQQEITNTFTKLISLAAPEIKLVP